MVTSETERSGQCDTRKSRMGADYGTQWRWTERGDCMEEQSAHGRRGTHIASHQYCACMPAELR